MQFFVVTAPLLPNAAWIPPRSLGHGPPQATTRMTFWPTKRRRGMEGEQWIHSPQELFLTPEPSQSLESMVVECDAGAGTSGAAPATPRVPPEKTVYVHQDGPGILHGDLKETIMKWKAWPSAQQIRRWKKITHDDTFSEIMNASGTADTELRAWRISLSENLNMDIKSIPEA
ncbi:uncharacterized protein LOC144268103 [Eretmochelys imbricata]